MISVVHLRSRLLLTLLLLLSAGKAFATDITVCYQSTSYYTNLNGTGYDNGLIAKLNNPANFGPAGQFGTINWTFTNFGSPSNAGLQATCDIWFSGWETDSQYTAAELTAIQSFVTNGGSVIAGCDDAGHDPLCALFGAASVRDDHPSSTITASADPIACPGEITNVINHQYWSGYFPVVPAGGQSITTQTGTAQVTSIMTESDHVFLFADINMIIDGILTNGGTVTSANDYFAMRLFGAMASSSQGQTPDCVNTLPVTLSYFSTREEVDAIVFEWETSSETLNFGFNLWAKLDNGWQQLNDTVIPSHESNSLTVNRYQTRIAIDQLPETVIGVGLSSVEFNGHQDFYGTYRIGERLGNQSQPSSIDWTQVTAQSHQSLPEQNYRKKGRHWVKQNTPAKGTATTAGRRTRTAGASGVLAEFRTESVGMHQVTHAELMQEGIDLRGRSIDTLTLTYDGDSVARHIRSTGGVWTDNSFVRWYATKMAPARRLHTVESVYRLEIATPSLPVVSQRILNRDIVNPMGRHTAKVKRDEQIRYNFSMPRPDPWYERSLFLNTSNEGSAGTIHDFSLNTTNVSNRNTPATVRVRLVTLTDFGDGDDHSIELVHVSSQGIETRLDHVTSEGYETVMLKGPVNPAMLLDSSLFRVKQLTPVIDQQSQSPPTGWLGSLAYFDRANLHYGAKNIADNDALHWTESNPTNVEDYAGDIAVYGYSSSAIVGYAYANGELTYLKRRAQRLSANTNLWTAQFPRLDQSAANYWFSTAGAFQTPTIVDPVIDRPSLSTGMSDYVIIAHPLFLQRLMTPDTASGELDFITNKQSHGHTVTVVDYEQVAQVYGHGHRTPRAITDYLKHERQTNNNLKFVLLVGSNSRDPHDFTGNGSWNLIPSFYNSTNRVIHYSPNDGRLADIDLDGFADLAIGRWPVRTTTELDILINKTIQFSDGLSGAVATSTLNNALLVADDNDGTNDFSLQMDDINQLLSTNAISTTKVYKDNGGTSADLITSLNTGYSITSYSGHAGPSQWSFNGLLHYNQIGQLTNTDHPTMMFLLSCYTTYMASESTNTLGQKLLTHSGGAVAIIGAATLSSYQENEDVVAHVIQSMLAGADVDEDGNIDGTLTIGEAVLLAKRTQSGAKSAINLSANLMGDPALRLR